jgi:hypothetical protein
VARPKDATLLSDIGIRLVTIANNHIADAGARGIHETLDALRNVGIRAVGAGMSLQDALTPAVVEIRNCRLGFLAFVDGRPYTHRHVARTDAAGAAWLDENLVREAVTSLTASVDFVIVSFHHGLNYVHYASPRQRSFARIAADAGATVVIGHHPHVLQGRETVHHTPVFYSLGELLLDPSVGNVVEPRWEQVRRLTAILELTLEKRAGVTSVQLVPYRRNDQFDLHPLDIERRRAFDRWFEEISDVYDRYDPSIYLEAASEGVVQHVGKVMRHHLLRGNVAFLSRSVARVRPRHLRILFHYLFARRKRSLARSAPDTPARD